MTQNQLLSSDLNRYDALILRIELFQSLLLGLIADNCNLCHWYSRGYLKAMLEKRLFIESKQNTQATAWVFRGLIIGLPFLLCKLFWRQLLLMQPES